MAYPELKPGQIATPEQIRQIAESMYNPAYQQALDTLSAQEGTLGTQRDRMREETTRAISDEMIKRNMGRSDQFGDRLTQGLADVEQNYLAGLEEIGTQRNTLSANYAQSVQGEMMNLMQYYEGIRQFNEQMALRQKELARSGGGGGSPPPSGPTAEEVYGTTPITPSGTYGGKTDTGKTYYDNWQIVPATNKPSYATSIPKNFTGIKNGKYYINGRPVPKDKYRAIVG